MTARKERLLQFLRALQGSGVKYIEHRPGYGWLFHRRRRTYQFYKFLSADMNKFLKGKKAIEIARAIYIIKREGSATMTTHTKSRQCD